MQRFELWRRCCRPTAFRVRTLQPLGYISIFIIRFIGKFAPKNQIFNIKILIQFFTFFCKFFSKVGFQSYIDGSTILERILGENWHLGKFSITRKPAWLLDFWVSKIFSFSNISSHVRYDHFDTTPYNFMSLQICKDIIIILQLP